jgi:transcriptional regulator with XRE-family HTH domain
MNQNLIIGENIKNFREKLGLTQEVLAGYLGINREEVSYYENGKRPVPTDIISKVAKLFGLDEYDLFETDSEAREAKVALAFRAESLLPEDLVHIADFRKIVLNYLNMKKALSHEPTIVRKESQ